jgi:lysine/ornithine N-monooxygenase
MFILLVSLKANIMKRLFLTTSDLQIITGTGYRNAYKIMQRLKDSLSKESHQHVTIKEYCKYEGISEEEVSGILKLGDGKKFT